MNWLAWRMLTGDRTKYLGIVFGVAFGTVLIAQQLAIFVGLMRRTSSPDGALSTCRRRIRRNRTDGCALATFRRTFGSILCHIFWMDCWPRTIAPEWRCSAMRT